jgi:hypothetical protein
MAYLLCVVEFGGKTCPTAGQPRLDCAARCGKLRSGLLHRQATDVVKHDCSSLHGWEALQRFDDSGLLSGHLDPFLMDVSSKKQFPTSAPSPDGQAIGNPADPALGVVIGGYLVPLCPRTDERLLYKIPGLGRIARHGSYLDDEPVPACPI